MNRSRLKGELQKVGLDRLAPDILSLVQTSIRLTSRPAGENQPEPGISHLGGLPDLPAGTGWPVWKGVPMAFVAQIRLEDAAGYDPKRRLPRSGRLLFFYDACQETYGADPDDRGGWQVFYDTGDPDRSQPEQPPEGLPENARFSPCILKFSREITLPAAPKQHLPNLDWTPEEIKRYEEFLAQFPSPKDHGSLHHRMLGYPDQLQDDMQLESALASNGIRSVDDPRASEVVREKDEWLLLLQVDSDPNAGMRWGSSGLIDYWIKAGDLKVRVFDRTWLVLQSD